MSSLKEVAQQFVDACDSGKGWETCQQYCHPQGTFSVQADALAGVDTLEAYTEWAKGLLTPIPDGRGDVRSVAVDEDRRKVTAYAVFQGTQSGEGGPVPPTGRKVASDYVYIMEFEGDKIRHLTKVWNDVAALKQLGWTQ